MCVIECTSQVKSPVQGALWETDVMFTEHSKETNSNLFTVLKKHTVTFDLWTPLIHGWTHEWSFLLMPGAYITHNAPQPWFFSLAAANVAPKSSGFNVEVFVVCFCSFRPLCLSGTTSLCLASLLSSTRRRWSSRRRPRPCWATWPRGGATSAAETSR